jgi:hypothetical protein
MVTFSSKFGEFKLEKLMGGQSRYCAIWHALNERGLKFVSCGATGNTIVFGMDKNRVWAHTFSNEVFFQKASDIAIDPDDFSETILKLIAKKNPKLELVDGILATFSLVRGSQPHRVLWATAVNLLDGERDRLFDDCFEMGDGSLVIETTRQIHEAKAILKVCDCKLSKVTFFLPKTKKQTTILNQDTHAINPNLDLFAF